MNQCYIRSYLYQCQDVQRAVYVSMISVCLQRMSRVFDTEQPHVIFAVERLHKSSSPRLRSVSGVHVPSREPERARTRVPTLELTRDVTKSQPTCASSSTIQSAHTCFEDDHGILNACNSDQQSRVPAFPIRVDV